VDPDSFALELKRIEGELNISPLEKATTNDTSQHTKTKFSKQTNSTGPGEGCSESRVENTEDDKMNRALTGIAVQLIDREELKRDFQREVQKRHHQEKERERREAAIAWDSNTKLETEDEEMEHLIAEMEAAEREEEERERTYKEKKLKSKEVLSKDEELKRQEREAEGREDRARYASSPRPLRSVPSSQSVWYATSAVVTPEEQLEREREAAVGRWGFRPLRPVTTTQQFVKPKKGSSAIRIMNGQPPV
jgi:hypothetical protein